MGLLYPGPGYEAIICFTHRLDAFAMSVTQPSQELPPPAELQLNQATLEAIIQGVAAKLKEPSSGPPESTESGSGPLQGKLL